VAVESPAFRVELVDCHRDVIVLSPAVGSPAARA
jgi:hypothetical protein